MSKVNRKSPAKSPIFAKPLDIFLNRKKKRLTSPSHLKLYSPLKSFNVNSPIKTNNTSNEQGKPNSVTSKSPFKRKTPKKCSPSKENRQFMFKAIKQSPPVRNNNIKRQLNFSTVTQKSPSRVPLISFLNDNEDANQEAPFKKLKTCNSLEDFCTSSDELPIDWSLKNEIKFLSTKPFPFKGSFKACEDASGTTSFTRCLNTQDADVEEKMPSICTRLNSTVVMSPSSIQSSASLSNNSASIDSSIASKLRQNCFVWIYPNIPWLNLFPRINGSSNHFKNCMPIDSQSSSADYLFNDWCYSLRSLYNLLKARQNAYFYVCGHAFTILFRSAGVGGFDEITAMIYPTTSGLRTSLKEEQINFQMPFRSKNSENDNYTSDDQPAANESIKDNSENLVDEEDSIIFLESLGLSQQDFPSLKQTKGKTSVNTSIDPQKTSLVLVKGADAMLLVTFLTDNQSLIAKTGPLAAIPPTLLSPVAFHGSSLHSLKMKQMEAMHKGEKHYCLDIYGPILPNTLFNFNQLFLNSQNGNLKASFKTDESTTQFSSESIINCSNSSAFSSSDSGSIFAAESLRDCGLSTKFIKDICTKSKQADKFLSSLVYKNFSLSIK